MYHFPFQNLTVDHILPQSKGGTDNLEDLQLLRAACNSTKGTISQAAFHAELTKGLRSQEMANQTKQDKMEPRIIELPHHSYQPSVAELNEDMRVDASFDELVKAVCGGPGCLDSWSAILRWTPLLL